MSKSYGLPMDLMTLWFQAPMVMAARMGMLATTSANSARLQAEVMRMFSEKSAAATEGMIAMQFAIGNEMLRALTRPAMPFDQGVGNRVIAKSLRPYGKRVRANAKRLSK